MREKSDIEKLNYIISKQRDLLERAHGALCDEVSILTRRPGARANTVRVLQRLDTYLNPPVKEADHE